LKNGEKLKNGVIKISISTWKTEFNNVNNVNHEKMLVSIKKGYIYSRCTNYLGNFVSILARYFQLSLPVWYRADMGGVRRPCKKVTLKYDLVR